MFTIDQINDLHEKLGSMKSFAQFVTALKSIGVEKYESYLTDGHSNYFGADGYKISSEPVHEPLLVADTSDRANFMNHLSLHEAQKTDYLTMSRGLAASGIEKWTVDTRERFSRKRYREMDGRYA